MLDENGCIDEEEWKDVVRQDQVLQELIRNLGREVANKLVRPWMIDVESLEEEKKYVVKRRECAQSKYVDVRKYKGRDVEVGDWVRIRLPGIIVKGSSTFSVPKKDYMCEKVCS
ncbi:hypothetical protein NDU88_008003 [Pleurodeles waltl]|uniref:Uncharacterized protein n=1 Tax=Pleurodeles waltl TaxID=8319 RepID=A0AAV7P2E6_PLEWA|nr:hypothetical protein NDU88_008003 [Pleurodeles waltl]